MQVLHWKAFRMTGGIRGEWNGEWGKPVRKEQMQVLHWNAFRMTGGMRSEWNGEWGSG
jgi:hypothetical protein